MTFAQVNDFRLSALDSAGMACHADSNSIFVPTLIAIRVNLAGETWVNSHLRRPAATSSVIMVSHKQISKQSGRHLPPFDGHVATLHTHFSHKLHVGRHKKLRPQGKEGGKAGNPSEESEGKQRRERKKIIHYHVTSIEKQSNDCT